MSAARPAGSATRALAWLYSPPGARPLLAALCALEAEIGASLKPATDHQVAHLRLEWWRAECARAAAGQAAHPLTREIDGCFDGRDRSALAGLSGLVDAAVWDLAAATFERRRELTAYCERWADAMLVPLVARATPQVSLEAGRALGAALREAELLALLPRDARAGRLRLPLDELAAAGLDPACLKQPPWPEPLAALLSAVHAGLRARLARAVAALPAEAQPPLRGVLVWAALTAAASQRMERRLPAALPGGDDHGLTDGWRAWRAARRAGAGRLTLG